MTKKSWWLSIVALVILGCILSKAILGATLIVIFVSVVVCIGLFA